MNHCAYYALALMLLLTETGNCTESQAQQKTNLLTVGLGWYDQTLFDPMYIHQHPNLPFHWVYHVESPDIPLFSPTYQLKSRVSIGVSVVGLESLVYGHGEVHLDLPRSSFTPRLQTAFYRKDFFHQKPEFRSQLSLDYEISNKVFFSLAYLYISNSRFYKYQDTSMLSINYQFPIHWFWYFE